MMRVFITIEWRMISMVKTVKGDNFEDIKACGVAGGGLRISQQHGADHAR